MGAEQARQKPWAFPGLSLMTTRGPLLAGLGPCCPYPSIPACFRLRAEMGEQAGPTLKPSASLLQLTGLDVRGHEVWTEVKSPAQGSACRLGCETL